MTAFRNAAAPGTLPPYFEADVCVIGAGAAGITLARDLAARGHHVLLVESGGERIEGRTQGLYVAPRSGVPYYDLAACRLRYYGGTTNHWSGYCRANDPIDYEGRPDLGLPAWPIGHETLEPYIAKAAELLEINAFFFDPAEQLRQKKLDPAMLVDSQSQTLVTKNFQISQNIRFGPRFREEIAANPRIDPVEHLNAVEIVLNDSGNVDHVVARTLDGRSTRLRARQYALCCHAIENARLLLESDRQRPGGIGNRHDHVGRNFMEHPHIIASRMIPSERFPKFYDRNFLSKYNLNANLSLSDAAMREHGIMSYYCRFNPMFGEPRSVDARRRLGRRLMQPASLALYHDIRASLSDLGSIRSMVERRVTGSDQPLFFQLEHRIEQAPNRDSRITLTDKRTKLGQRQIHFHWALSDIDLKTFNRGQEIVARELSALHMGRFELETIDMPKLEERVVGHYHHMGTTRMASAYADGVVDPDLKVHDVGNLYIGGSSVFPTAGYSGPTMMLVALAMRLGEHLSAKLGA